ncbi:hypothetical protein AeRB84_013930, partial [Aphanomyces euteiches]
MGKRIHPTATTHEEAIALALKEAKNVRDAEPKQGNRESMTSRETVVFAMGFLYMLFTLSLSLYYLNLLAPSMTNDLWWGNFNTSGTQSYLIDVFNSELNTADNERTTLELTAKVHGLGRDYSHLTTPISTTYLYPRIVLDAFSEDLAVAIRGLLKSWGPHQATTQYCWVDFNRTWEVAHTDLRQKRCEKWYTDNAAVYYEAICRLIDWNTFYSSSFGIMFNKSISAAIAKSPGGLHWLEATPYAFVDVKSEVMYWQHSGIRRYAVQYSNVNILGVEETIVVRNALGSIQTISLKRMRYTPRGYWWTTGWMNQGPWTDLAFTSAMGLSLVRSDSKHPRFAAPCRYSDYLSHPSNYSCEPCNFAMTKFCSSYFEQILNLPNTVTVQLIHDHIGPLNSIDLYFVRMPSSLRQLYLLFQTNLAELIVSDSTFALSMSSIPSLPVDPVPTAWKDVSFMYFGGDPTCLSRQPTSFVQSSFSFFVACTKETRQELLLSPQNTLFALWLTNSSINALEVCDLACVALKSSCTSVLSQSLQALRTFNKMYPSTRADYSTFMSTTYKDIAYLGVSTIQFAINVSDNSSRFLRQLALGDKFVWDFFGWVYMYEWAAGLREVVSFEGDVRIIPLVSDKYEPHIHLAQSLEVTSSACQYLWIISVIVTSGLVVVATLLSAYSVVGCNRFIGRNLFQFNRLVGAVWIGRPLLVVRGMTAVILLSTAPIKLETHNGVSHFTNKPRTIFESMVVSSEAMWISYVMNDALLVFTQYSVHLFTPLSGCLVYIVLVIVDLSYPANQASAWINRQCETYFAKSEISCESGEVNIGSFGHAIFLVYIQAICVIVAFLLAILFQRFYQSSPRKDNGNLLLHGTATALLHKEVLADSGAWMFDRPSAVMCGLIPFRNYIFDLKLWLVMPITATGPTEINRSAIVLGPPHFSIKNDCSHELKPSVSVDSRNRQMRRLIGLAGLIYMCLTLFGSVSFLVITSNDMTNDFWWANYNVSREHTFMARLFNDQLMFRPHEGVVTLDDPIFIDAADYSASNAMGVDSQLMPLYSSTVLMSEATHLVTVVQGLRNMDACLAPWISTQYCWLDFNKTWEMANTMARQMRCSKYYSANAAVYFESVLRNVDWSRLRSCWATSLDIGFAFPLKKLPKGDDWWQSVQSIETSEIEEAMYWHSFGISTFATDWQNYKTIGIIETFSIQNAFGLEYPLTIKHTNGSINVATQSSMKMYWGFASDLWAITNPTTYLYNTSLIRQDARFAFKNVSIEQVLKQNETIRDVEFGSSNVYRVFRQSIGPFGSVDLKRIPAPKSLIQFGVAIRDAFSKLSVDSADFCHQYITPPLAPWFTYFPPSWSGATTVGGNLLCNDVAPAPIKSGLKILTGGLLACGSTLQDQVMLDVSTIFPMSRFVAVVGLGLIGENVIIQRINEICATIVLDAQSCKSKLILPFTQFLGNATLFSDPNLVADLESRATIAQNDIEELELEVAQYGKFPGGNLTLLRHKIFDPAYPAFHFVAWILAYDWAIALREVISFQGDIGTINVISSPNYGMDSLVNPLETPVNVAQYIRTVCLYVTCILILVASVAFIYAILSKGHFEGLNMLELNRVAGLTWIGRPFLFVRSMVAICLLSTQVLALEHVNDVWKFTASSHVMNQSSGERAIRFVKTILAA